LTPPGATGIVRDCVLVHPSAFVKLFDAKKIVAISCPQCGQPVDLSGSTEQPASNVTVESAIDHAPSTETVEEIAHPGGPKECLFTPT
jgi:hypothetical protein